MARRRFHGAGEFVRDGAAPAQPECDDLRPKRAVMTKTGDGLHQKRKRVGSAKPSSRGATVSNSTTLAKEPFAWRV
jgi:hypothetical protein